MEFKYQALNLDGAVIASSVAAANQNEAAETLREQGLMILHLSPRHPLASIPAGIGGFGRRINARDLLLFTRQMKMLLETGASLVPALEAVEKQTHRPAMREVVAKIRRDVEDGGELTEALRQHPRVFSPVFCSTIAAGESTATLPTAFDRLSILVLHQRQVRKTIVGALFYPCLLAFLTVNVFTVLLGFVVPRFGGLFETLRAPVPSTTSAVLAVSSLLTSYWPILLGVLGGLIAATIAMLRTPSLRARVTLNTLQWPVIGRIAARLQLARTLRIWAAMLRSHVPLIETIQQSRAAVSNLAFVKLLERVEETVSSGGRIGEVFTNSPLVEPVIASAIATGEENGRLTDVIDFVSGWVDEDNTQLITAATRLIEPLTLGVMGLIVGLVALSLFLPLFDVATAGGG